MDAALAAALTTAVPLLIICMYGLWHQKPEPKDPEHDTDKSDRDT